MSDWNATIDDAATLIDSLAKIAGVLVWPSVLIFILIKFRSGLNEFISSLGELSWKFLGFEGSAKRMQNQAVAALGAAAASRTDVGTAPESAVEEARAAVDVVSQAATPNVIRQVQQSKVLWVDDRPNNNVYVRRALEAIGIRFAISMSTEDAISKIKSEHFDLIISDMGRPLDPQAGYTLLDKLREDRSTIPYIIYAGSRSPEHQAQARKRGAVGCTNNPNELFTMVLEALGRPEDARRTSRL